MPVVAFRAFTLRSPSVTAGASRRALALAARPVVAEGTVALLVPLDGTPEGKAVLPVAELLALARNTVIPSAGDDQERAVGGV